MTILLRILKYTPAVMPGLLVVAWVVSCFCELAAITRLWPGTTTVIGLSTGNLLANTEDRVWQTRVLTAGRPNQRAPLSYLGRFHFTRARLFGTGYFTMCSCPLPFLSTLLLPLAIGPFTSFRFRLWHFLAYTALVAVELAYYLHGRG